MFAALECQPGQVKCSTGGVCVSENYLCDGTPDCPDRSDEVDCGKLSLRFVIHRRPYEALYTRTVYILKYLNYKKLTKLVTGKEHIVAPLVCCAVAGPPECDDTFFTCRSGRCIPVDFKCDGKYDCGSGDDTDEKNCTSEYWVVVYNVSARDTLTCLPLGLSRFTDGSYVVD